MSSALTRSRGFFTIRFPNQLNMIVCCTSAVVRFGSETWITPAAMASSTSSRSNRECGSIAAAHALRVGDGELDGELGDRAAVVDAPLALARVAPFGVANDERAEARERVGLRGHDLREIFERLADGLFEQGEEELVLPVEVLVKAPQRLLRAIDHLLDGELGRPFFVDQLKCRIQETLDALLGPGAGGVEAS